MSENAERSYVDMLSELSASVKADMIPITEKDVILRNVETLEQILWKYSA